MSFGLVPFRLLGVRERVVVPIGHVARVDVFLRVNAEEP